MMGMVSSWMPPSQSTEFDEDKNNVNHMQWSHTYHLSVSYWTFWGDMLDITFHPNHQDTK